MRTVAKVIDDMPKYIIFMNFVDENTVVDIIFNIFMNMCPNLTLEDAK